MVVNIFAPEYNKRPEMFPPWFRDILTQYDPNAYTGRYQGIIPIDIVTPEMQARLVAEGYLPYGSDTGERVITEENIYNKPYVGPYIDPSGTGGSWSPDEYYYTPPPTLEDIRTTPYDPYLDPLTDLEKQAQAQGINQYPIDNNMLMLFLMMSMGKKRRRYY